MGKMRNGDTSLFLAGEVVRIPPVAVDVVDYRQFGWDFEARHSKKGSSLLFDTRGFYTPHIQFGFAHYSSAFFSSGLSPEKCITFIYARSRGIVNFQNEKYRPNELFITTDHTEFDMVLSDVNEIVSIAVEENFFHRSFQAHYGRPFDEVMRGHRFAIDPKREWAFIGFVSQWLDIFAKLTPRERFFIDYPLVEQEILHGLFGFLVLHADRGDEKSRNLLKKSRELLHDNLQYNLKINDIVTELGISQRGLEYLFRKNLGISPKNYLQLIRLHAAHDDLLKADPGQTKVSDIAVKYAFFHMSHFAAEYKKLFGETPSQTLMKGWV